MTGLRNLGLLPTGRLAVENYLPAFMSCLALTRRSRALARANTPGRVCRRVWVILFWVLSVEALLAADSPQPLQEHYQLARAALGRGDAQKAERELKLQLQENPLDARSHFLLASLLAHNGEINQAIAGYQEAVSLQPNNAVARYNLGTALLFRGEPFTAARHFEDALAVDPNYAPAYVNLGKAYFMIGLPELTAACYEEALRLQPSSPVAKSGLVLLAQAGALRSNGTSAVAESRATASNAPPVVVPVPPIPAVEQQAEEVLALRDILRDLPHVTVSERGGRITLSGWTSGPAERKVLDKILAGRSDILDLTGDDIGDPHRLLEVDAILFTIRGLDSQSVGHNFLQRVQVNATIAQSSAAAFSWMYSAAISYEVNIANAIQERVGFLARPHLTALSGSPATFIAGGDIVFKVSGTTSGDIKPYPFGTELNVTPTLLRTQGEDGTPRVRLTVKVGRKSILPIVSIESESAGGSTAFDNIAVTSEAVLGLNQTLILSGLNQRERLESRTGVPILKSIPLIKYLFSNKTTATTDLAIIMLLTPRDPAFWDEQNQKEIAEFVEKRRAYVKATQAGPQAMEAFKQKYPDWNRIAPNRFASHFFLIQNSEAYRRINGIDLATESLDYDILGKLPKDKAKQWN
jgi:tetratricopeptide (TPR) repeat protein